MAKVILLLLSLALSITAQSNILSNLIRPLCGANEKYTACGSSCIETCKPIPQICNLMCKSGCFCIDGYVRESDKSGASCIDRRKCPVIKDTPKCAENEEYLECSRACPATCDDIRYPVPKPPQACIALCKAGCSCKQGYFRAEDGSCVPPDQCCGENEKYKSCGSACVETCDGKPTKCTRQCVPGCFCACNDYVRRDNDTGSPCIPRDSCPEKCDDD